MEKEINDQDFSSETGKESPSLESDSQSAGTPLSEFLMQLEDYVPTVSINVLLFNIIYFIK